MNDKKFILKLIIICLFIIIIILILLLLLRNNNSNSDIYMNTESKEVLNSDEKKEQEEKTTEVVTSPTMFYTVENILKEYFKDKIADLEALDMRFYDGTQFKQYCVYANITTNTNDSENEFYIVILDEYNTTYKVEKAENMNSIDDIELKEITDLKKIENTGNNSYTYVRVDDKQMSVKYYNKFKKLILNNPREAYNKLSKEYREKRFNSLEKFIEFVSENKDDINNSNISGYLIQGEDDDKKYVCKDQYGNIETFTAKSVMDYEVTLDTYTIVSDTFKTEYSNGNEEKKVKLNINKFMQMINNSDFESAYNLLDETFKKNNFQNVEDFKQYVKTHMYRYNSVSFGNIEKNGEVYVSEVEFEDSTNGDYYNNEIQDMPDSYEWSFVVKLIDENSFVMSFSIE